MFISTYVTVTQQKWHIIVSYILINTLKILPRGRNNFQSNLQLNDTVCECGAGVCFYTENHFL